MNSDYNVDARATPDDAYSKEVVKEFVLQRLKLTPSTLGRTMEDVPEIVRATGGLQHGGHLIELFNRFEEFKPEWFDHWYLNKELVEGHVLRGALRIVNANEYPYYFRATRSVARRRRYQNCPAELGDGHFLAIPIIEEHGPLTLQEFRELFGEKNPLYRDRARRILMDLYNHGEVARTGRKGQKPLFHSVKMLPYLSDMLAVDEEEARDWLLLKCLSIYGPLTPGDIAHWVDWNITETTDILRRLLETGAVLRVKIEHDERDHYLCSRDLKLLDSLRDDLPEHEFIRILFNDDSLLLGYYPRLRDYFGYPWRYPQFSEGIVWRAGILYGRELAGDAVVEMFSGSKLFSVKRLTLRKEIVEKGIIPRIKYEFQRHAAFHGKSLQMARAEDF
jgi:hypothetical protein